MAVGSRSPDAAAAFATTYRIPHRHVGAEALVADPRIDVVYIATPHPWHAAGARLALAAGKAVLCEKPFAMSAAEAAEVFELARRCDRFVMEAMWTRLLPAIDRLHQWLAEGRIGTPRMVQAGFGFRAPWDPQDRLLNPALGGGALLDVGVYPVALAQSILGAPTQVTAHAQVGATGVDELTSLLLAHPGGGHSQLACAVRTELPADAWIIGTEGRIRIHPPFWRADRLTLEVAGSLPPAADSPLRGWYRRWTSAGGSRARLARFGAARLRQLRTRGQTCHLPPTGHGFVHEIEEVGRCLRAGRIESPLLPHGATLDVLRTLDAARAQIGTALDDTTRQS